MLFFRRVSGESMLPLLREGQFVIGLTRKRYTVGDVVVVVVAQHSGREIIKRVKKVKDNHVWLEGDNFMSSTDSRQFGWIDKSDILGVMKHSLPIAQDPPRTRASHGPLLGWIAAGLLIMFSLIHLFRIDTFVPELSMVLGGNQTATLWIAALVVTMQVFALPFLMRMKLSPLAQYVSGAFAVIVPLFWLLIALWTYGSTQSTAQFGEFIDLPSSILLILANGLWVACSFYAIWALGYDNRSETKHSYVNKLLGRLSK